MHCGFLVSFIGSIYRIDLNGGRGRFSRHYKLYFALTSNKDITEILECWSKFNANENIDCVLLSSQIIH